jgi:hypothetical protein
LLIQRVCCRCIDASTVRHGMMPQRTDFCEHALSGKILPEFYATLVPQVRNDKHKQE